MIKVYCRQIEELDLTNRPSVDIRPTRIGKKDTVDASEMAPYSLFSSLLLTSAHSALFKSSALYRGVTKPITGLLIELCSLCLVILGPR